MKLFLTGGTGFLGRNLDEYYSASMDVLCYRRGNDICSALSNFQPDYIIHSAGEIYNNHEMMESNVLLTYNILTYCAEHKIKKLIYFGSSSEYGVCDTPMSERNCCNPESIYAAKKNYGNILMMIDADVVFSGKSFSHYINELLQEYDIVFQNNEKWYNFDIFALNSTDKVCDLFEKTLEKLESTSDGYYCETLNEFTNKPHDQHIINDIVRSIGIKHTSLTLEFFGGHFGDTLLPADWVLYHATNTYSIEEKIIVLDNLKKSKK